jgi:hypothetical protein
MMLDAERSEPRSARCALQRAETPCERGLASATAGAAPGAGLRDDVAPAAAPLTPPAAAPAPCARRAASPSVGVRSGGPRSRGRRAPRRAGASRLAPPLARCWHTLATVDEQAALELPAGGDVGAGGTPLDSRGGDECALCRARPRSSAARTARRARLMSDQEPGSSAATSGGSTPSLPSSGAKTGPATPPGPAEQPRAGGGAAPPALDIQALLARLEAADKRAADVQKRAADLEAALKAAERRAAQRRTCTGCCVS